MSISISRAKIRPSSNCCDLAIICALYYFNSLAAMVKDRFLNRCNFLVKIIILEECMRKNRFTVFEGFPSTEIFSPFSVYAHTFYGFQSHTHLQRAVCVREKTKP